jgi:MAF protein
MTHQTWILASNSPRRKELLGLFQEPISIFPADIDESELPGEAPGDYVKRLAHIKAEVISTRFPEAPLIIAADTTVADQNEILGKPVNEEDARRMLKQLRGRQHQVYTAVSLVVPSKNQWAEELCLTEVPMRNYTDQEVEEYIASGDPMDKAGAYAIQHRGFRPVESFRGCFASVMGFPLCHVARALVKLGLMPDIEINLACQRYLQYDCPIAELVLAGDTIG